MKENQAAAASAANQKYTVANSLTSYYLALMFGFFPLFLTEQYAHARTDKFWLFLILTAALTLSVGACMLMYKAESKRLGTEYRAILPLTPPDVMMLCFYGFAAASTVLSDYPSDSFTGFAGRDNGLLLMTAYMLMYFIVTRSYVYKDYVLAVYLIVAGAVALLTVLNFFYIDPLSMLEGYDEATAADFGSTIGNKNMIAAFMCLYLPVAVMTFAVTEKRFLRAVSAVTVPIAYTGLICADSTSDILGLIVILPVMLIFSARRLDYLRRCVLAYAIAFLSGKLLLLFGEHNKGFEFIQRFLIESPLVYAVAGLFAALYLILRFVGQNAEARYPAKTVRNILVILFLLGIISSVGLFAYFSAADTVTDLGDFEKLLRFSDSWGTHRGFMWRVSFEEFARYNPLRILFGSGPDTVYHVLEPHFEELLERFGDGSTDCAHNEYINYLLSQGVLGLCSYLGLMAAVIVRGLKTARKNPLTLIFISAVVCYLAQSVVNLYTPIVTPLMFVFTALTEALNRQKEE